MTLLVVGMSHRSAPVALLERASVARPDVPAVLAELTAGEHVGEALLLSTCNRVEVIADVERFHGGVNDVSRLFAERCHLPVSGLGEHLYVHYEDDAVAHLFAVAAGLDSMVVGESQVLGQLRAAYAVAREQGTVGRVLHELCQQALRVGKRAHAETGIDRVGASLVAAALDAAQAELGELAGRRAVVVGAGAMGSLAATTLRRRGVTDLVVVNRNPDNAARLAAGLGARSAGLGGLAAELVGADLLIASTGAIGLEVPADAVTTAVGLTGRLVVLDLALPHDVDPAVAGVPGVTYVDLERLGRLLDGSPSEQDVAAARDIVDTEVAAYTAWQRSAAVAPTVAALRTQAAGVVEAELRRLAGRLPELSPQARAEVAQTVRRVVDKLLHAPTVRVKELAGEPGGEAYAAALRELFGLDPEQRDLADAVAVPALAAERPA